MKKIKMLLYGEPGVGKSVFASKAPRPFFITTDGNYEWLEDFGAKEEDHIQVNSWEEAKQAFEKDYSNYDTIVVDLLEDLFKWCEYEFCIRSRIDHLSDIGFGKGYDITRNEFFLEISKLLSKDKHIILLSHGITFTSKDRRGVEHTKHAPSSRIPDKVMDMIEGRLRYCLRCYLKAEESDDGTLIKRRYLSLVPKENEFGIARGLDESKVPHDIPLEFDDFAKAIGLSSIITDTTKTEPSQEKETIISNDKDTKSIEKKNEESKQMTIEDLVAKTDEVQAEQEVKETKEEIKEETKEEVKEETKEEVKTAKPLSNDDKLAAIRAKLAAIKAKN